MEFEELCKLVGFVKLDKYQDQHGAPHSTWRIPDSNGAKRRDLPPQDMNTLFEWMVPKLNYSIARYVTPEDKVTNIAHTNIGDKCATVINVDPFQALAQAMYAVLNNKSLKSDKMGVHFTP